MPLADVAHTVNHHRTRHKTFAAVCARDRAQAVAGLRALAAGNTAPGVVDAHRGAARVGHGVRVFGSGLAVGRAWARSCWPMSRRSPRRWPSWSRCSSSRSGSRCAGAGAGEPVVGIDRIQPVLVGMQLALTALWRSYGVEPDAVIGHSMGEVTAAVVAGALTPGRRAEGDRHPVAADVAAVRAGRDGAAGIGRGRRREVDRRATPTSPWRCTPRRSQTVIAGPPEQVDAVIAVVDAQGRLARRVEVDVASHHPTIDPILPELRSALADLAPDDPEDPADQHGRRSQRRSTGVRCRVLGRPICATRCGSVRPSPPPATDHATFVEISPHPLLTYAISDTLAVDVVGRPLHRHLGDEARGRRNLVLPCAARRSSA